MMDPMMRALKSVYCPPIRGRSSKKRRQRQKAMKKYEATPMQQIIRQSFRPIPFLDSLPKSGLWGARLTIPAHKG